MIWSFVSWKNRPLVHWEAEGEYLQWGRLLASSMGVADPLPHCCTGVLYHLHTLTLYLLHTLSIIIFRNIVPILSLALGITMYRHLPRHTFGFIQGKLFPKYFLLGTILSSVTLLTYVIQNPVPAWEWEQKVQVIRMEWAGTRASGISPIMYHHYLASYPGPSPCQN